MKTLPKEGTEVWTPGEVATYLCCDRRVVYDLVHSGALPAAKVSRTCWRITRSAVLGYLEGKDFRTGGGPR